MSDGWQPWWADEDVEVGARSQPPPGWPDPDVPLSIPPEILSEIEAVREDGDRADPSEVES